MTDAADLVAQLPFGPAPPTEPGGMSSYIFAFLTPSGDRLPPHWSRVRDSWLRQFWLQIDPLKIVVNTFVTKASGIPLRILPSDRGVKRHIQQAVDMEYALVVQSGIFEGFRNHFERFGQDYLTQDNGGHALVMGPGPAAGPIIGPATGIYHLDAARVTRTGDPVYPIVYDHTDGKRYRIYYTRWLSAVNMPSPRTELNGVGLCPLSNVIDSATEMKDISIMSQEKMGSRPARRVLYAKKGATIEQLKDAFGHFETKLDNEGLQRFAKTLLLAPKSAGHELDLGVLDVIGPHDGFSRMDVFIIDMAQIAAGFGLDLLDMAVAFGGANSSLGNQEVADRKGRGKGVNNLIERMAYELDYKFLPRHLVSSFDNLDDEQDEQQALIRDKRSTARERDLRNGVTTPRVERVLMLRRGELTPEEFEELEMFDGRQPDGTDLLLLFDTSDPDIAEMLTLPMSDPTNITANEVKPAIEAIHQQTRTVWRIVDTVRAAEINRKARRALAALQRLRGQYEGALLAEQALEQQEAAAEAANTQSNVRQRQRPENAGAEDSSKEIAAPYQIISTNGIDKH